MSERFTTILGHPLVPVFAAFLLTGVVGTWLTNHYMEERAQAQLERTANQRRHEALQVLVQIFADRNVRAELLVNGIMQQSAKKDLAELKKHYDDSYMNWQKSLPALTLIIRDLIPPDDAEQVFQGLDQRMVQRIWKPLRSCIMDAYNASIAGKKARKILQSCEAPELIARSGTCGGAIVDVLFELLPNSHKSVAEHESRNILKDARKSLDAKCS